MGLKQTIKKGFWGEYLISLYHCAMSKIMPKLRDDETAIKSQYKKRFGKDLDLEKPQTYSEKLNWYKLNDKDPLMEKCADKVSVRDYIKEKGYGSCLNEIYGVYEKVEDIDPDLLPSQFVIKAAHGSHMIYIVKDKSTFDWRQAKKMMKSWLHQDIYWSGREWVYKDMPKRLVIEKYLEDETGDLRDYKFFCFHGKPYYLQVDIGRYKKHYRNYYSMDQRLLDCRDADELPHLVDIPFPVDHDTYNKMLNMCSELSSAFQQVRVDLYTVNQKIYFGELTFFCGGGYTVFYPDEWNYKISEQWMIGEQSKISKNG